MKMKYISLAVMAALSTTALTACGGSDGDKVTVEATPTTAQQDAAAKAAAEKAAAEKAAAEKAAAEKAAAEQAAKDAAAKNPPTATDDKTTVDPTGNAPQILNNINLGTTPTVVGQNYIRNSQANFDYRNNTNSINNGSPIALGDVDLDSQNPELTNIVVGYNGTKTTSGADVKRFVGGVKTGYDDAYKTTDANPNQIIRVAKDGTTASLIERDANGNIVNGVGQIATATLQDVNGGVYGNPVTVLAADGTTVINTGITQNGVQVTANAVNFSQPLADDVGRTGLVYKNVLNSVSSPVYGTEGNNNLSTRIFGKNYRDINNTEVNSYQFKDENYTAAMGADYLKATPIKLNNVQYGRVSSNIDALAPNQNLPEYVVSNYRNKQASDAVSNYFYRGTNETSIAQMAALPKDQTFTYYGHALTYGLDAGYAGSETANTPNSFGVTKATEVLGNFVKANYQTTTGKVDGTIYNAVKVTSTNGVTGVPSYGVKQADLVKFDGYAKGNTVAGDSYRLDDGSNAKGLFRASFYGDKAQEMGGAVNSITSGYGSNPWGAVFGAQKVEAPTAAPVVTTTDGWLIQDPNATNK